MRFSSTGERRARALRPRPRERGLLSRLDVGDPALCDRGAVDERLDRTDLELFARTAGAARWEPRDSVRVLREVPQGSHLPHVADVGAREGHRVGAGDDRSRWHARVHLDANGYAAGRLVEVRPNVATAGD